MCITSEQPNRVTLFTPSALGRDHVFTGDNLRPQCTKFRGNMPLDVSSMSNKESQQEVAPIHHNYFPNSSSKDMHHPQSYHLLMTGMAPIKWMKIHSYLFSPALSLQREEMCLKVRNASPLQHLNIIKSVFMIPQRITGLFQLYSKIMETN